MKKNWLQSYNINEFADGVALMLSDGTITTLTVFRTPLTQVTERIRLTRRSKDQILLTFGKPNYAERQHIISCRKKRQLPDRLLIKRTKATK